jgi:hypothetical protein
MEPIDITINGRGPAACARTSPTAPCKRPATHRACGAAVTPGEFLTRAPPKAFLAPLVRETRRPLRMRTERGPRLPGPMPAIRARQASPMQPQQPWALEDGEVANAPRPTLLASGIARLASGTHQGGLSSLEMPIQPLWADDLLDDVECWQTEHGFDTIESQKQGSSFWVTCFPEFCEESCACQLPLSVPFSQAQMLASNLAKSPSRHGLASFWSASQSMACCNALPASLREAVGRPVRAMRRQSNAARGSDAPRIGHRHRETVDVVQRWSAVVAVMVADSESQDGQALPRASADTNVEHPDKAVGNRSQPRGEGLERPGGFEADETRSCHPIDPV